MKDSLKTKKGDRQRKESDQSRSKQDSPYPSWDDLKAEDREEAPLVLLTIRDTAGNVVRRLRGSTSSGIHRITWDFQHAGLQPQSLGDDGDGPMALPGKYTVTLSTYVQGEHKELTGPVEFECVPMGMAELTPEARVASVEFQKKTADLQRVILAANSVLNDAMSRIRYTKAALNVHHDWIWNSANELASWRSS